MSIIQGREDLELLYKMAGEKLTGIIYEPEESGDLTLVFEHHTVNVSEDGVVTAEKRYATVTERLEAEKQDSQ